jgi:hypothetical protein
MHDKQLHNVKFKPFSPNSKLVPSSALFSKEPLAN